MIAFFRLFVIPFLLLVLCQPAFANPDGARVLHGHAQFHRPEPGRLTVTNAPNTIINWQGFSIGTEELTRFVQQSADSAVLNRVVGGNPSDLLGTLASNGRVFLINPHGILFGPDAVVDTAGFVAATLALSDADFLSGNLRFVGDGDSGRIVNRGLITVGRAGNLCLIAPVIENRGVLHTEGGRLLLAAGEAITITSLDLKGVHFEVQAPENTVLNLGKLLAEGGAAGIFAGSLTHGGEIRAGGIRVDETGCVVLTAAQDITLSAQSRLFADGPAGGRITVESRGGTVRAAGEIRAVGEASTGGEVKVLGQRVALYDSARIDASGLAGGGRILIGGDYRGANPAVANATTTFVGDAVRISADAVGRGDGGTVVVWADDTTRFNGTISARGGGDGGDGGTVEVSGKKALDFAGSVNTAAPRGRAGTLQLDPETAVVQADGGAATESDGDDAPAAEDPPETVSDESPAADTADTDGPPEATTGEGDPAGDAAASAEGADSDADDGSEAPDAAATDPEASDDPPPAPEPAAADSGLSLIRERLVAAGDTALCDVLDAREADWGETALLALLAESGIDPEGPWEAALLAEILDTAMTPEPSIDPAALVEILDDGTHVTVTAAGDIVFQGGVATHGGGNLTLTAGGDVHVASPVTLLGGSFFSSGNHFRNTAAIGTGGGDVSLNHSGNVTLAAAVETAGGTFSSRGAQFDGTAARIATGTGSARLNHGGSVALGTMSIGGALTVTAGGDITQSGALAVAGSADFSAAGQNRTRFAEAAADADAGSAEPQAPPDATDAASDTADGESDSTEAALSGEPADATGPRIVLDVAANALAGPVSLLTADGSARVVNDGSDFQLTASYVGGSLSIATAGDLLQTGETTAGRVILTADGDIALTGSLSVTAAEDRSIHVAAGGAVSVSGTLEASGTGAGETGGSVRIAGETVLLTGQAEIDASGAAGGGEILVGGDYQGGGDLPPAAVTVVDDTATLRADALAAGDGGRIIVWADEAAAVYGTLSARGGALSGDGGFVETSGKRALSITTVPDVTAAAGAGGTWLIDPYNVDIVAGSGNTNMNTVMAPLYFAEGSPATIGVDLIESALTGGVNVQITTGMAGSENGDITLSTPLDINDTSGTNTLTLAAARNININDKIYDSVAGGNVLNLKFAAGSGGTGVVNIGAAIDTGGGSIDASSSGTGQVVFGASAILDVGDFSVKKLDIGSHTVTLNKHASAASTAKTTVSDSLIIDNGTLKGSGTLSVASTGTFDFKSGTLGLTGGMTTSGTTNIGASGNVTLDGLTWQQNYPGKVSWTGGNVTLQNGAVFENNSADSDPLGTDQGFHRTSAAAGQIISGTGGGSFTNNGDFHNVSPAGWLYINVPFTHSTGRLVVSDHVQFNNNVSLSGGKFEIGSGKELILNGGTHTFSGGTVEGGTFLRLQGSAALNVTNNLSVDSLVEIDSSTITVSGGKTLTFNGDVRLTTGTSEIKGGGSGATVKMASSGSTFDIKTGKISDLDILDTRGTTTIGSVGAVVVTGTKWYNYGTAKWTANNLTLSGATTAFNNQSGGTFELNSSGTYTDTGTSFTNAGQLTKSSAGTTTVAATFSNAATGKIGVTSGTLAFGSTLNNSGGVKIGTGATLSVTGDLNNASGATIAGVGTISLTGTLNNAGTVSPGASPGTLTLVGNYSQGSSGVLSAELGGTGAGAFDVLKVNGTVSLDGTLSTSLYGSYTGAVGDQFDVIDASGTLSGAFATITPPSGYTLSGTPIAGPPNYYRLEVTGLPAAPAASPPPAATPEPAVTVAEEPPPAEPPPADPAPAPADTGLPGGLTEETVVRETTEEISVAVLVLEDRSEEADAAVTVVIVSDEGADGEEADAAEKKKGSVVCKCKKS